MAYPTDAATKYFVAMALKRHPWAPKKMLQLGHFKSRNEEIRNGNEEMGNEKK